MAEIVALSYNNYTWTGGGYGNLSCGESEVDLNAAAINDTVQLYRLPRGFKLFGVKIAWDALGAGSSIKISYRKDDATVVDLFTIADTATAGASQENFHPIYVEEEVDLIAEVLGGVATGKVSVSPEYLFRDV